jgi:flagellar hook-associated protein 2
MASVDTNLVAALGAGSGVDVKALAKGLTEAEKAPRQAALQDKIDRQEARISGYSALMAGLNNFKTAVDQFDSTTDFAQVQVRNSNASAISVATNSLVSPGLHSIQVTQLAQAQRSSTAGFDNVTATINGGEAFSITISIGPVGAQTQHTIDIPQASTNLSAVANAINNQAIGVSAQVLDTGDTSNNGASRYRLVFTGQTGEAKSFTVETQDASGQALSPNPLAITTAAGQAAADAQFTVNGVALTRSSNTVADVIPGATLDLLGTTSTAATLQFTRDSSGIKDKMKSLVQAYNDLVSDLKILTGPKSDDEEDVFSGSLKGDSTVRTILSQIRTEFFGQSQTKGTNIASLRDLGVSVDKEGLVTLDEAALDTAVGSYFEQVVTALSGRQSVTENDVPVIKKGLAANLSTRLRDIMAPTGIIVSQSNNAETQVGKHEDELKVLEERMEGLLARYTKQFAAMESLVGQLTSMRENLKSQFEAMLNQGK